MLDQNVFQHIQQIAKQQELLQSEIEGQNQFRMRLLEEQQQQFDMEIEQVGISTACSYVIMISFFSLLITRCIVTCERQCVNHAGI